MNDNLLVEDLPEGYSFSPPETQQSPSLAIEELPDDYFSGGTGTPTEDLQSALDSIPTLAEGVEQTKLRQIADVPDNLQGWYEGRVQAYRLLYEQEGTQDWLPQRMMRQSMYGLGARLKGLYYSIKEGDSEAALKNQLELQAMKEAMQPFHDESILGGYVSRHLSDAAETVTSTGYGAAVGATMGYGVGGAIAANLESAYTGSKAASLLEGDTEEEAEAIGRINLAAELVITTAFGAAGKGGLESLLGSKEAAKSGWKPIAKRYFSELAEEETIEAVTMAGESAATLEAKTPQEMAKRFVDTAVQTAFVMGMGEAGSAARRFISKENPTRKDAKEAGLPELRTAAERKEFAEGARVAQFRQQLKGLVGTVLESEEQADYLFRLVDHRANALGETAEEYLSRRGVDLKKMTPDEMNQRGVEGMLEEPGMPAFNRWFKESAAVDEMGDPKVFYHGTARAGFDEFNTYGGEFGLMGGGTYFTENPEIASEYATTKKRKDGSPGVYPVYLSIQNPLDMDLDVEAAKWKEAFPEYADVFDGVPGPRNEHAFQRLVEELDAEGMPDYEASEYIQMGLERIGHDGITHIGGGRHPKSKGTKHRVFVAFHPEQIKSATANEGTYDPDDPNILKEKGKVSETARAAIDLRKEGEAVIAAFEKADFTSMVHELGHLFRRDLAGEDLDKAGKWAGAKDGTWGVAAEEKFANGFVKWLREGESSKHPLAKFFAKFKGWLTALHDSVRQSREARIELTPEIREVFEAMFKGDPARAPQSPVETQQQNPTNVSPEPAGALQAANMEADPAVSGVLAEDETINRVSQRWRGLANHAVDDAVRQMNYEAASAIPDPDRRSQSAARAAALQRIAADPVGELQRAIEAMDAADASGGTVNLTDMQNAYVFFELRNSLAQQFLETNDRNIRRLHFRVAEAIQNARTEIARSLALRDPVDPAQGYKYRNQKLIAEVLTRIPVELSDARKAATTPEGKAEVEAQIDKRYNELVQKLKDLGLDVENDLDAISEDTNAVIRIIQLANPKDASLDDMLYEYWRNAILSGPKTMALNAIGTPVFYIYKRGVEKPLAAVLNNLGMFGKDKAAPTFGEYAPMWTAFLTSFPKAVGNAVRAWRLEQPQLEESLGRVGTLRIDENRKAIPGVPGRVVRSVGYGPLSFADDLWKTMIAHMEASAYAYRVAKAEGAQDVRARIEELMADPMSSAWDMGILEAQMSSFQAKGGALTEWSKTKIDKLRGVAKPVKYVIPFRDTPANIFEEGIKRIPLLGMALEYVEARRSGQSISEALTGKEMLARQTIGFAVAMLLARAVDDEDPWITGTKVEVDSRGKYIGPPPLSIKIAGEWYSYSRAEPFAVALGSSADIVKGLRKGDVTIPLRSLAEQTKEKNFLEGVGDVVTAVTDSFDQQSFKPFGKWGAKFAASWVPNLIRQPAQMLEDESYIPQRRVWGEGADYWKMLAKRTAEEVKIFGVPQTPRYDPLGRRLTYNTKGTSFLWRSLVPINTSAPDDLTRVEMAMFVWNERNPDNTYYWTTPDTKYQENGQTVYWTDEQYAEYTRRAGEYAAEIIRKNKSLQKMDPENPKKFHIDLIAKILTNARSRASKQLKAEAKKNPAPR